MLSAAQSRLSWGFHTNLQSLIIYHFHNNLKIITPLKKEIKLLSKINLPLSIFFLKNYLLRKFHIFIDWKWKMIFFLKFFLLKSKWIIFVVIFFLNDFNSVCITKTQHEFLYSFSDSLALTACGGCYGNIASV